MKYIDTTTQRTLQQGVLEILKLTNLDLYNMFESIYNDAEKEPWQWVEDFLSDYIVDEEIEFVQMFHLTRRLDGTDLKANNNLEQLLLENTPLSQFFVKHDVTFKKANGHIDLYYKGDLQPLDNEFRYADGNMYYVKSRLGHNATQDYCVNGFAFGSHLEENDYYSMLALGPELVQQIEELLGIKGMTLDYRNCSRYYCIQYLIPLSEVIFDINYPPETNKEKVIEFLKRAILRLYDEWLGSSFAYRENLIFRLEDDANINPEWFISAEELER